MLTSKPFFFSVFFFIMQAVVTITRISIKAKIMVPTIDPAIAMDPSLWPFLASVGIGDVTEVLLESSTVEVTEILAESSIISMPTKTISSILYCL